MKVKNFKQYLEKRLDNTEIDAIEQSAKIEFETYHNLQTDVAHAMQKYMLAHSLNFNECVKKLGKSPQQLSKIMKGEANLTLATIAQLYAFMGNRAHIVAD